MLRLHLMWVVVLELGCSAPPQQQSPTGKIPPNTPSRPYDANGDGAADGLQYDLDGDGKFDAVDLDGDGLLEGGDFDGDGKVTIFSALGTGLQMPTATELAQTSPEASPDVFATLGGSATPAAVNAGAAVDLSSRTFRPLNQGDTNSCAAFAAAAVATLARVSREGGDPNALTASPAYLYERMVKGSNTQCGQPTVMATGFTTLVLEGALPLSTLSYDPKVCAANPSTAGAEPYRLGGFTLVQPFARARVKELLTAGLPIAFGCTLPGNFQKWGGPQAKGVFKSEAGQLAGSHGAGHAMVVVGYDDARGAYRVLNSWGTDWGDSGFVWWDYADLEGREGLHGFAPILLDAPPAAGGPVTAETLDIQVVGAAVWSADGSTKLTVRLRTNGAVAITEAAIASLGASAKLLQVMSLGDLSLSLASVPAPGTYALELKGGVVAGTSINALQAAPPFTRTVMVTVGEPTPTSN